MHSSLAVTTEGLPLGLAAAKFWTRDKCKGTNALKKHINPTRVPIEEKESIRWLDNLRQSTTLLGDPSRCVHVGDRESDIYELFCTAKDSGAHFLLRTCVDRLAGDGTYTIAAATEEIRCKGLHRVEVQDRYGEVCEATLELKFRRIRVLPPIGKQNRYPEFELTVLHATERGKRECERRWSIRHGAVEHRQPEDPRVALEDRDLPQDPEIRLPSREVQAANGRALGQSPCDVLYPRLPPLEIRLLNQFIHDDASPSANDCLSSYLIRIARLGGYLARASDPPPGNTVIWRGMSRLTDIEIGFMLGAKHVGN